MRVYKEIFSKNKRILSPLIKGAHARATTLPKLRAPTSERPQPLVFFFTSKHPVPVGPEDVLALLLYRQHVPVAQLLLPAVRHLRRVSADGERLLELPGFVQAGGEPEQDFGDGGGEGEARELEKPSHLLLRLESEVLVPHQQVSVRGETAHEVGQRRSESCERKNRRKP